MCGFENTSPVGSGSFTPTPRAPGMPMALADTFQAAGVDITDPRAFDEDRRALEAGGRWAKENPYDAGALALSSVPVLGDVAGVANDVRTFATDPDSRTLFNYGLSAAGLLPGVPSLAGVLKGPVPRPKFAQNAETDPLVYNWPTKQEIEDILSDPDGGQAIAFFQHGDDLFAWRREAADHHGPMVDHLEGNGWMVYDDNAPMERQVFDLRPRREGGEHTRADVARYMREKRKAIKGR